MVNDKIKAALKNEETEKEQDANKEVIPKDESEEKKIETTQLEFEGKLF